VLVAAYIDYQYKYGALVVTVGYNDRQEKQIEVPVQMLFVLVYCTISTKKIVWGVWFE